MRRLNDERGRAAVELVAVLPVIVLLAALLWQAAIAGQVVWLAGSAARAAARARAVDADAAQAARGVLPEGLERGMRVRPRSDGGVDVALAVRSLFGDARLATVERRARFEPQRSSDDAR